MKILIINKSDSTGGAAVVSRRLMEALREEGEDARMLVAEKLTDSPYIAKIAPEWRLKGAFIADRLRIAVANGGNRKTLFKLDAAAAGIDISRHPWVKEADAIILNWINQGVLSLQGIRRLMPEKKILWVMHDMWNFTGLCHHADRCEGYTLREPGGGRCGYCPMLGRRASRRDLSFRINKAKKRLYKSKSIRFIAVSNWLAERARESWLLSDQRISVIPNAFPIKGIDSGDEALNKEKLSISAADNHAFKGDCSEVGRPLTLIFGAARLDDQIKDFPLLIESLEVLKAKAPELASRTRLILFGGIKDETLLSRLPLTYDYKGMLRNPKEIADLYRGSDIVISTSKWETLPGTLIEGQAYGAWPLALPNGGQTDIIDHGVTGWLAVADGSSRSEKAVAIADGIIGSEAILRGDHEGIRNRLRESVERKFSAKAVAREYIGLLRE